MPIQTKTLFTQRRKAEWKGAVSWLLLCHALCFALFFRRKRPNESERQGQAIEKSLARTTTTRKW
uniref:Putative ovule protein n=1 Tax=Solanum chacoense TaxID=4108 RepID=A0A0V0HLE6_SOLCH